MEKASRYGVTSVNNMLSLPGAELDDPEIYKNKENDKELTVRIFIEGALTESLERAEYLRENFKTEKVKFTGLKEFLDGVAVSHTAYMIEPYNDKDTYGTTLLPPEVVKKWVVQADMNSFRVRLHACGDGAVRLALDCYEKARKENGYRDIRHTIEHLETVHPDDFDRLETLNVIASIQPEHMAMTEQFKENPFPSLLGKKREPYFWPNKSFRKSNALVAFGSDFPVVELNPLLGVFRAVTREHNDGMPENGWNPQEKVSMAEALKSYTINPAIGSYVEDKLGTLKAGKLADIVVLDKNLLACEPEEILSTEVLQTIMDGKIVYGRGSTG